MIKIVTGYSAQGGSTVALSNLAKEFNEKGINCEFYGPHDWHLGRGNFCKKIDDLKILPDDKYIIHFCDTGDTLKDHKVLLFCHELWWFDFKRISKCYNKVIFLNQRQADYHSSVKDYSLIPNIKEEFKITRSNDVINVAGIIGTIEPRKNTHLSIKKALNDGCNLIYIFGMLGDLKYFRKEVEPLLNDKVQYLGYEKKDKIYSMIDRVYHMSSGEVASLVKDECHLTNTLFFGNEQTLNEVSNLTNDQIIDLWKKELEI